MERSRLNKILDIAIFVVEIYWKSQGRVVEIGQYETFVSLIFGVDNGQLDCKYLSISDGLLEFHLDLVARNGAFMNHEPIEVTSRGIVVKVIASLVKSWMSIIRPKINLNIVIVAASFIVVES